MSSDRCFLEIRINSTSNQTAFGGSLNTENLNFSILLHYYSQYSIPFQFPKLYIY